ncbi:hypothetical protein PYK79_05705 [Streptomyces sp. ID05-04B]|uniref:hypothetical protein n=1 Tax=unclassified Streptomyces TaxID=2593676 RepID=UPI000D1BBBF8|nr:MULTISPECIES: hypothetical protein [unclassified Streptomyces]AVV41736.1 hypothetical protein C6376_10055 [Streptomyces sp. P3]MDX5563049.1 hypothetical protein [Streptomyces sp. ID05-04B]
MDSTGFAIMLSVLLIVGAVGCVVAQRRDRRRPPSGLDAEAEAHHWLVRLAGGLVPPDVRAWAGADAAAERSMTRAAQCHRSARARLATARTAEEYEEATRLAKAGLEHLAVARAGLGPGPAAPAPRGSSLFAAK